MGVKGLFSFLKSKSDIIHLKDIPASRIGIDISYYIYKFQANADKILNFISECRTYGHKVILIFDGRSADTKATEIQRRRGIRDEESTYAKALKEQLASNHELTEEQHTLLKKIIQQHENRGWYCSKEERHALKRSLYEAYIPMLKSKGEADWLLTSLSVARDIDIVISADMDLLVLGVQEQLIPTHTNVFRRFKRNDILSALGITDSQFREFCSLCSSETESRTNIYQAYHGIRIYKSLTTLQEKHPEWMSKLPTNDSPLLKEYSNPITWIREDEEERYNSWKESHIMKYLSPD